MSVESLRLIEAEKPYCFWKLIDFDGVIANDHDIVRELIFQKFGLDINEVLAAGEENSYWLPEWRKIRAIPGAVAFCYRLFRKREVYDKAVPFPGAVEILNKWHDQGDVIGINTSRASTIPEVREASIEWLIRYGLEWLWPNVYFGGEKNLIAQRWRAGIAVDDYEPVLAKIDVPVKILFGNHFYQDKNPGPGISRARDWWELDKIVQSIGMSHNIDTELVEV